MLSSPKEETFTHNSLMLKLSEWLYYEQYRQQRQHVPRASIDHAKAGQPMNISVLNRCRSVGRKHQPGPPGSKATHGNCRCFSSSLFCRFLPAILSRFSSYIYSFPDFRKSNVVRNVLKDFSLEISLWTLDTSRALRWEKMTIFRFV